MATKTARVKKVRTRQPLCHDCVHPLTFHANHVGSPCKALGCRCSAFVILEAVQQEG